MNGTTVREVDKLILDEKASASGVTLLPAVNCWVTLASDLAGGNGTRRGQVVAHDGSGQPDAVQVRWGNSSEPSWHHVAELRSGFVPGDIVQDRPRSNTRRSIGVGTALATRRIASRDMVLVQWHKTGESRWIPYEYLVRLRGPLVRYLRAEEGNDDAAERFRLKALAYALDSWNQVTGALDRMDVDPLPHQIDIVHRIMSSDQDNWLIADDVGLGKTIEVGLLLAALNRRRRARRILIVCPAGLVRQWQDELATKFNEEEFRIYGRDFSIWQAAHWSGHDKVIASIDLAKSDNHLPKFADSGDWDLIVFDEAHHLSKLPRQAVTQRYRLAEQLRQQTDAFVFLTGTPHQGNNSQFVNVLTLLRPDLGRELGQVFTNPAVVAEMVLRNKKSTVTDMAGELIFKGQDSNRISVPLTEGAKNFDTALQNYLKQGYEVSHAGGLLRAIGFVMTTYRKLASSSVPAIQRALSKRLERLQGERTEEIVPNPFDVEDILDSFEDGTDGIDDLDPFTDNAASVTGSGQEFFQGEVERIENILSLANDLRENDSKMRLFLDDIVDHLYKEQKKLLIFTEYRATQEYIVDSLAKAYPNAEILQIHGGMDLTQKLSEVAKFGSEGSFMVCTEAGGEGINLHHRCHVMVNYDLPWNPARLVQRAGRLYRYGQTERVQVFNLVSSDGFDSTVLSRALERVEAIARDMAEVSQEFDKSLLETEIIGELLERLDMPSILAGSQDMDINRTQQEIETALRNAQQAKEQQDQLFSHVESFDPNQLLALHTFGPEDLLMFLEGILPLYQNIEIRNHRHDGRMLEIRLPDELRGRYSDFPAGQTLVRITTDRVLAATDPSSIHLMDFKSPFLQSLIEYAQSPSFGGEYATIVGPREGVLGLFKLRWQNDQGVPTRDELLPVFVPYGTKVAEPNPDFFGRLLGQTPQPNLGDMVPDQLQRRETVSLLHQAAESELAKACTAFRHPNDVVLLAVADITTA